MTEHRFPTRTAVSNRQTLVQGLSRMPLAMATMGYASLRPGQREITNMLMAERDVMCILPTGGGKCLAKDTPVVTYAGSVVKVQHIVPGDLLMGPDGLPRRVTSVCRGREEMFRITPKKCGDSYVVNRSHILSFRLASPCHRFSAVGLSSDRNGVVNMGVVEYLSLRDKDKGKLTGWRALVGTTGIKIERTGRLEVTSVGEDEYFGFELSGPDRLFLLGDFTVTHNTACFVLPALACQWPTLVFSPLTALMRDQVQSLQRMGISAAELTGLRTDVENQATMEQWAMGDIQFLYVAPERMANPRFMEVMRYRPPHFLVVDEAHCLSTWADSFREHYKFIGDFVRDFDPKVVAAFSATMPVDAEQEVRTVLGLQLAERMEFYHRRTNLVLSSEDYPGDNNFVDHVVNTDGPAIVYCTSIKRVEQYASLISQASSEPVALYHGDMDHNAKRTNMDMFMDNVARIVVATNAFGMGIDHQHIRNVIHRDIPKSSEALVQEVGRAGRDGQTSWCHMFYSKQSENTARNFVKAENPTESDVHAVYHLLEGLCANAPSVCISTKDIALRCGIMDMVVPTVLTRLKAAKVIERSGERSMQAGVEFRSGHPEVTRMFIETRDMIYANAEEMRGNTIIFNMAKVAEELGIQPERLRSRLRSWAQDNLLAFYPPFRSQPLKVIGGIELVDFGKLRDQADASEIKLQQVIDYHATDDAKKHEFLESIFKRN